MIIDIKMIVAQCDCGGDDGDGGDDGSAGGSN